MRYCCYSLHGNWFVPTSTFRWLTFKKCSVPIWVPGFSHIAHGFLRGWNFRFYRWIQDSWRSGVWIFAGPEARSFSLPDHASVFSAEFVIIIGGWVAEWLARRSFNPRSCGLPGLNLDRRSAAQASLPPVLRWTWHGCTYITTMAVNCCWYEIHWAMVGNWPWTWPHQNANNYYYWSLL